ncbi:A24 family peptidase [Patescibacteria group bacterium]|nr:A24 family peptidase [Patescibacteria group bacterium]
MTGILFVLTTFFVVNNFQFSIFNSQSILNSLILNSLSLIILLYYLFIVSSLVVIFFTDLKYGVIPDKVVFPGILISLVYLFLIHNSLLPIRFIASAGAFLFLLFLHLITRGRGMGMGDVKFSFLMGLFLGFPKIVSAFYIAFLTGAVFSLILVLWRKKKFRGTTIPFGPFLVFGTLTAFFLGEKFIITGVLNQLTALF